MAVTVGSSVGWGTAVGEGAVVAVAVAGDGVFVAMMMADVGDGDGKATSRSEPQATSHRPHKNVKKKCRIFIGLMQ